MSQYNANPVKIAKPIDEVYSKVSDLSSYQQYVDRLPADVREKIGQVRFEPDAIVITAQPVGEITLRVTKRTPGEGVTLEAENSPVPLRVNLAMKAIAPDQTELTPGIDVEVPMMMRPFVAPKMQEAANRLGNLMGNLFGRE